MELLEELRAIGWYLSEEGLKKVSLNNKCTADEIIKLCLDIDFREIAVGALSSRRGETLKGPIVLQVQWIRNIAAPKANESSSGQRLLCVELSDGQQSIKALELEKVPSLDLNVPPGTKILFRAEQMQLLGGYLPLKNQEMKMLGGNVTQLVEKWEVARSMQLYARSGRRASSSTGPPPWVAFGKNLDSMAESQELSKERNFKSLQVSTEKEKDSKENEEFNAMRSEAIAEAAKTGAKKVFGGGGQQILDHNVKKILDKGYSEEEAKYFLKANNNNLERALFNLKRRQDTRNTDDTSKASTSTTVRSATTGRDFGGKRGAVSSAEEAGAVKPAANVSLFDFLTDKLPTQNVERSNANNDTQKAGNKPMTQFSSNVQESKTSTSSYQGSSQQRNTYDRQSGSWNQRSSGNRQQSDRYKPSTNEFNGRDNREHDGGSGPHFKHSSRTNRNPRDEAEDNKERNNASRKRNENERPTRRPNGSNFNQNTEVDTNSNISKATQDVAKMKSNDNRNNRYDYNRNQPRDQPRDQQRQQPQYVNMPKGGMSQQKSRKPSTPISPNNLNSMTFSALGAGMVNQHPNPPPPNMLPNGFAYDPSKIIGFQTKEANEYAMNLMKSQGKTMPMTPQPSPMQQQPPPSQQPPMQFVAAPPPPVAMPHHFAMPAMMSSESWAWKVGDLCMAKYWDDGQYYEAEITGISDRTCVVFFIGYGNHEEVLKADCLPITDAQHRPINKYNSQPTPHPPQQQPQRPPSAAPTQPPQHALPPPPPPNCGRPSG